jgi:hypothetical protein
MAQLQNTTYAQNTIIHSSGSNVVRPPITGSANVNLTNSDNLVYVTNVNTGGRLGDAIQIYYASGAGYVKYITYGP